VCIWDLAVRRATATLTGHTGMVRAVAISAGGSWLATGSDDVKVRAAWLSRLEPTWSAWVTLDSRRQVGRRQHVTQPTNCAIIDVKVAVQVASQPHLRADTGSSMQEASACLGSYSNQRVRRGYKGS
jgi:hypothetical protein